MITKQKLIKETEKELNNFELLVYYRNQIRIKLIPKGIKRFKCEVVKK